MQTQMPKHRILASTPISVIRENDWIQNSKDEVQFCLHMAKEQLPIFKKRSKLINLCHELALKFKELIKNNPKLKAKARL